MTPVLGNPKECQVFKKVLRPQPIYVQVAKQIEDSIIGGDLTPGERLSGERELAEKFDISRRTLREALRVIEQKGLIEIKKGGAFVREPCLDQFSESLGLLIRHNRIPWKYLLDFRLEMDSILTRKATLKATAEDIANLQDLIRRGRNILQQRETDWKALVNIDLKIHLSLARIAGNPIFEWVFRIVIDNTLRYYEQTVSDPVNFAMDSFNDMIALVEAVKMKDVEAAVKIIRDHATILGNKYFDKHRSPDFPMFTATKSTGSIEENWGHTKITRKIQ